MITSTHSLIPPMSEEKMSPAAKWKLLFSTFLNTPVDQLDLAVESKEDELLLSTYDQHLAERLAKVLNSPAQLKAALNYTLSTRGTGSNLSVTVTEQQYPPLMALEKGMGSKVYEQLFDADTLKHRGYIRWQSDVEVKGQECFVLQGDCNSEFSELDTKQVNFYREYLAKASFEDFRMALSADPKLHRPLSSPIGKQDGPLAKDLDKILYRSLDGKKVFLDYGLLLSCLKAPELKVVKLAEEENSSGQYQIRLSKTDLINYFSVIFNEGFVFNVTGDSQAARQQATPILFSMRRTLPLKNVHVVLLDRSGSMDVVWSTYIDQVKNFITELSKDKNNDETEIRFVPFDDKIEVETFDLKNITGIFSYLSGLNHRGGTAINKAVNQELAYIESRMNPNENYIVDLFTDGQDNASSAEDFVNIKSNTAKLSQKQGRRPKFFCLGLGNFNKDKLIELATITGGAFIELKTIEDFKMILDHTAEMSQIKEFMTFVQGVTQFVTPAYSNDLSIAADQLTIPGAFSAGGNNYWVDKGGPKLLSEPTPSPLPTVAQASPVLSKVDTDTLFASLSQDQLRALFNKFTAQQAEEKQKEVLSIPQSQSFLTTMNSSLQGNQVTANLADTLISAIVPNQI